MSERSQEGKMKQRNMEAMFKKQPGESQTWPSKMLGNRKREGENFKKDPRPPCRSFYPHLSQKGHRLCALV
jgi:hypothetical protein